MPRPRLGRPVVTFDKGSRVARLEDGARLDARQAGILLSRVTDDGATQARLLEWDETRDPAATARMHDLLATKGATSRQTLLLALSMAVLRRFEVRERDPPGVYLLEGDRTAGFVVRAEA